MSYGARSSSRNFWVVCCGFLALSGWWLSGPLTVLARVNGGVVKVVERSGSAGAGSVVSWRFGLFLDRDDAQVFVVEGFIY